MHVHSHTHKLPNNILFHEIPLLGLLYFIDKLKSAVSIEDLISPIWTIRSIERRALTRNSLEIRI